MSLLVNCRKVTNMAKITDNPGHNILGIFVKKGLQLLLMHANFFITFPIFVNKPPSPMDNVGLGIGYSPVLNSPL